MFKPTKNPQEKFLDQQNTPAKKLATMNYPQEKISAPRNNDKKKFCTNKPPSRKHFAAMKY